MLNATDADAQRARWRVLVRGVVQGVGFRPFVYRLAQQLRLGGWVRNDGAGVTIEVEGRTSALADFVQRLRSDAPPLARVDAVDLVDQGLTLKVDTGFVILQSGAGPAATAIGPDSAMCSDCVGEMLTPTDRRWRYAFINCTNCGPRYTLTRALPYDRAMTSMAGFAMCPACLAEYRSPADRRFHAEPNACPMCGPHLSLVDAAGAAVDGDPVAGTLARIRGGEIVAIKGLGGFHLVCDARNATAVATLRARKAREEKPFAVMVANVASAASLAQVSPAEVALLVACERPIVLMRKAPGSDLGLVGVAPGLAWLGVMLPYTPLQLLLFHEAAGRPPDTCWLAASQPLALVMTSANPGGEPLVTGNDEAMVRLAGIADAYLLHDRDIVQRCDDSVLRVVAGAEAAEEAGSFQFVRRARGYTPRAIALAAPGPAVLALGGYFKNTVCVARSGEAFVSQHIGDLDNAPTCRALDDAVAHLLAILQVRPALIAHDLHPDIYSTHLAARLAAELDVPTLAVQHHHAHIAAVLAEHCLEAPVIGLALDGVGLGSDGSAWGGELLRVDGARFKRLGRLRRLQLPGGDRAAREPWRMAAAALALAGQGHTIASRFADEPAAAALAKLLERGLNSPQTSSLGRWFDAAAGLLGVRRRMAFEGQAAMLLEGLAEHYGAVEGDASLYATNAANELDLCALALRLAQESQADRGAALFHATLVEALAEWAARAAIAEGLQTVACGGGCFLNAVLARGLRSALKRRGLTMLQARAVPPNDGGLALGQAWVARHAG
jgi:hydrogenase maturation protein HypF